MKARYRLAWPGCSIAESRIGGLHGVVPRQPDGVVRVPEMSAGAAATPDSAMLHPG